MKNGYRLLTDKANAALLPTPAYAQIILDLCSTSHELLEDSSERVRLTSLVPGKNYFALRGALGSAKSKGAQLISRPVNAALYIRDRDDFSKGLAKFLAADYASLDAAGITRLLYTMAMSFCAVNDLTKAGDKKTPATFFERFVAHLFARQFQVRPTKRVKVPAVQDQLTELPTDFVFDLGPGAVKIHLPIKLSTRDRVIQAWAHQKVLEGVWGYGGFKGILVVLSETKLDLDKLEVVEIALPQQWAVYQRYIAKLDRVYYLDMPERYAMLSSSSPRIDVKQLGEFWAEKDVLLAH